MFIAGLQKTSLLDYPGKIAAIVFTQGCNFRCGYCHNPELLSCNSDKQPIISEDDFFEFLKIRRGKLDGVVITGGEPCLQENLTDFISKIKELGFDVKLDTNGSFPLKIKDLLEKNLLDYIAMDIKSPLNKYHKITGTIVNTENIRDSIDLIMNSNIDYEFRTTVLSSQLTFDDFENIGKLIKGAKRYYLQKFVALKIYNSALYDEKSYSDEEFNNILNIIAKYSVNARIR